jgi:hypothetical protein
MTEIAYMSNRERPTQPQTAILPTMCVQVLQSRADTHAHGHNRAYRLAHRRRTSRPTRRPCLQPCRTSPASAPLSVAAVPRRRAAPNRCGLACTDTTGRTTRRTRRRARRRATRPCRSSETWAAQGLPPRRHGSAETTGRSCTGRCLGRCLAAHVHTGGNGNTWHVMTAASVLLPRAEHLGKQAVLSTLPFRSWSCLERARS